MTNETIEYQPPVECELTDHQIQHYLIIKMFFLNKFTYSEIAITTGLTKNHVISIINKEVLNIAEAKALCLQENLVLKEKVKTSYEIKKQLYEQWVSRGYCSLKELTDIIPDEVAIKRNINEYIWSLRRHSVRVAL